MDVPAIIHLIAWMLSIKDFNSQIDAFDPTELTKCYEKSKNIASCYESAMINNHQIKVGNGQRKADHDGHHLSHKADGLKAVFDRHKAYNDGLKADHDKLKVEHGRLEAELDKVKVEREKLVKDRDNLVKIIKTILIMIGAFIGGGSVYQLLKLLYESLN